MNKPKLDYHRLLDDWADKLHKTLDDVLDKEEKSELGSYHYGYYRGYGEGLSRALAELSILENRKSKKYEIKEKWSE